MLAGLSLTSAHVRAIGVASPCARASIAAGTLAAMCVPGDAVHCTSMTPLIMTFTGSGNIGNADLHRLRIPLEVLHEPSKRRADVPAALVARSLRAACAEHRVDALTPSDRVGRCPPCTGKMRCRTRLRAGPTTRSAAPSCHDEPFPFWRG